MKTIEELMLLIDTYADAAAEWAKTGAHSDSTRAAVVAALREALEGVK